MFKLTAIKALPLTLVLLSGCVAGVPGDPVSSQTPGFVALQKGDNATAVKDLSADNANTPHSPYDELDLGLAYQRQGRMDLAEPLYRQAMTDGNDTHPSITTTQWSKDMTVGQIACENLSLGLQSAPPATASPCQTTLVVAVVTPGSRPPPSNSGITRPRASPCSAWRRTSAPTNTTWRCPIAGPTRSVMR